MSSAHVCMACTPCLVPLLLYCPQHEAGRPMTPWRRYKDGRCSYYGKIMPCPQPGQEHSTDHDDAHTPGLHAWEQPREHTRAHDREHDRDHARQKQRQQAGSWQWQPRDAHQAHPDIFIPSAMARIQQLQQNEYKPSSSRAAAFQFTEPEPAEPAYAEPKSAEQSGSAEAEAVDEQSASEPSARHEGHMKPAGPEPSR